MTIVLAISILLNILLMLYLNKIMKDYFYTLEGLEDMVDDVEIFLNHLERVHASKTYYGDATLENLMKHSKEIVGRLQDFENILSVTDEGEEDGEKEEE